MITSDQKVLNHFFKPPSASPEKTQIVTLQLSCALYVRMCYSNWCVRLGVCDEIDAQVGSETRQAV